jgi:alkanesulfonate monooxygenase SsuD/methylene tetrahydromethanopterin reductase-like flavin-dependent oxidoreductase (luciferase family)
MTHIQFGFTMPVDRLDKAQQPTYVADLNRALHLVTGYFDSVWVIDHLQADDYGGMLEGFTALTYMAALHPQLKFGHTVLCQSYRNPALLAKMGATLQLMSGGRFILGIGGGWFEREHDAFGLDFGAGFGERLDRLDEAVGLIRRLLDGETVTHDGRYYAMHDAVCEPRPVQARLPILIGGSGPNKTLRTTARYADLWNGYGEPARIAEVSDVLRERCAEVGRPFEAIERTVTLHAVIRDTRAAADRAWAPIAARHGLVGRVSVDGSEKGLTVGGSPDEVAAFVDGYRRIGIGEVMFVFRDPFDRETIERIGQVRAALGD